MTTQVWIAVATYVLVALVKKRLALDQSLNTILQLLNLVLTRKRPFCRCFQTPTTHTQNLMPVTN